MAEFLRQNFRGRISFPHKIFKREYLELLISKSSDSKTQIHLHMQNYNFREKFILKYRNWLQPGGSKGSPNLNQETDHAKHPTLTESLS